METCLIRPQRQRHEEERQLGTEQHVLRDVFLRVVCKGHVLCKGHELCTCSVYCVFSYALDWFVILEFVMIFVQYVTEGINLM